MTHKMLRRMSRGATGDRGGAGLVLQQYKQEESNVPVAIVGQYSV